MTRAGYEGILAGGIVLIEVAILNVTVLGTAITERSIFPLLKYICECTAFGIRAASRCHYTDVRYHWRLF